MSSNSSLEILSKPIEGLENNEILAFLEVMNEEYRTKGISSVSDEVYDLYKKEFILRAPAHPFNQNLEVEPLFGQDKIKHSSPMLSTQKLYEEKDIVSWINRIKKAAIELGRNPDEIILKSTLKLDGLAGSWESNKLATRGDGSIGNDVTFMLSRGIKMMIAGHGERELGEICVYQPYFEKYLSDSFSHPRGVVVSAVGSKDVMRQEVEEAAQDGALRFVSYNTLPFVETKLNDLLGTIEAVRDELYAKAEYAYDGIVIVVDDKVIHDHMGYTGHHYNGTAAFKQNTEIAEAEVESISWQVGRTKVTPVLNIKPISLSGAIIRNVTAHNAKNVLNEGFGVGAKFMLCRSGEVIPKALNVTLRSESVFIPSVCPSCETTLEWDTNKVSLLCLNEECREKVATNIEYSMKMLGIDLFGPKACQKIVDNGIKAVSAIFDLKENDFENMGFGLGQAKNMVESISVATKTEIDDFKILASLGIQHLGRGDSKKLLKNISIKELIEFKDSLSVSDITLIDGFGDITAKSIVDGLKNKGGELETVFNKFNNVIFQSKGVKVNTASSISGLKIVFTGTFLNKTRDELKADAESLGATIQSSVNGKTDILVTGAKVGASKINKAISLGTKVLSEEDYINLIVN